MSGINCKCGTYFSTGSFPCPTGYRMFSEEEYDELAESASKEQLFLRGTKVYKCPRCGRIVILWKDKDEPVFYNRE
jgi:predicted RNA-binding Zn-ribbon protein involved in translation (DUF1610 family)